MPHDKVDQRQEPRALRSALEDSASTIASRNRSPLKFFVLVFALSTPFLLLGAMTGLQLLPGLPVSALAAICPAMAASILVYRENQTVGIIALLKRSFDWGRVGAKWYVPTLLVMPGVAVTTYGLMRLLRLPLPSPQLSILAALAMFVAFFIGALGEELGWSGYVLDPLQARLDALGASILLGLVCAAWHIVPLVQAHRAPAWIAWWCLYTVAGRVLITWLYNNTGKSVFAAALFHDMNNISWQLFPNHGSHWDPRVTGLVVAFAAAIVTAVWGPRTLARYRSA